MNRSLIEIIVNGAKESISPGTTVSTFLASRGIDPARIAVERNREVVARSEFGGTELRHGDKLEIVTFVGGG